MEVHTNIPLSKYTTMKLGGNARFMTSVHKPEDVREVCLRAKSQNLRIFILGGGSNSIARDEGFDGIVIRNRINGIEMTEDTPSSSSYRVGGGESWDNFVKLTVENNLSGLEALSSIPGSVGASPVQNIGAYGQEVSDTIISVEAYDIQEDRFVVLQSSDCQFAYRSSIFRENAMGRFFITHVSFIVSKNLPRPPFYKAIEDYFSANNVTIYTPAEIRKAVIEIRTDKLPDPAVLPNTGSFFKNAIIDDWRYNELKKEYPSIPSYEMPNRQYKIPTGWLIEQTGMRGKTFHGMKVHDKNALVLINDSASSYADLASARDQIAGAVRDKFQIQISQEPLEIV